MSDNLKTMLEAMPASYQKTIGYPTYDILAAAALRMDDTDRLLADTARKLDPANLTGAELESYILSRTGQRRKPGAKAVGAVTVKGNGLVPAGTIFESAGGVAFAATSHITCAGSAVVPVCCTQMGAIGNLPPGSITQMPMQVSGIYSVTNEAPTHNGYDAETDAAYYSRFLIQVQTPPTSGNVYHYMSWALEINGVGAVQVYPLGHGDNTVDVVIADTRGLSASGDLVAQVQEYIDPGSTGLGYGQAPIGAHCYVSAAKGKPINLQATLKPMRGASQSVITAAVTAAVVEFFKSIAFQAAYVSYARVTEAILQTAGVDDIEALTLNGGTANVILAEREVPTLGTVVINYA